MNPILKTYLTVGVRYYTFTCQINARTVQLFIDLVGWIGSIILLVAYVMVSYEKLAPVGKRYQWLNLAGSVMLLANTIYYGAYPSAFLNIFWGGIALLALFRILKMRYADPMS